MALYKYLKQTWRKPTEESKKAARERLLKWRREPVTTRVERPTRLDRARSLGYKAKPGIIIVRQRVLRGGHTRPDIKKGRRSKHSGQRKVLSLNYQTIAEQRVARKYRNTEVLNSYYVAQDGKHYWYEVIVVDRDHPVTKKSDLSWISKHKGRAFRGLTSAARKGRGLRNKGSGAEKIRPSLTANKGRGN